MTGNKTTPNKDWSQVNKNTKLSGTCKKTQTFDASIDASGFKFLQCDPQRPRFFWSVTKNSNILMIGESRRTSRLIWQIWLVENAKRIICAYSSCSLVLSGPDWDFLSFSDLKFHNVEGHPRWHQMLDFPRVHKCNMLTSAIKLGYNVRLSLSFFFRCLSFNDGNIHGNTSCCLQISQWHYLTRKKTMSRPYFLINSDNCHTKKDTLLLEHSRSSISEQSCLWISPFFLDSFVFPDCRHSCFPS